MAYLEKRDGAQISLGRVHVIGRSRTADARLEDASVSAAHACVRFAKGQWHIRDLGSRNGTWVNGERLRDRIWRALHHGDCVQFASAGERWWLADASPPSAVATSGTERLEAANGLLILPNAERPEVSIVFTGGEWRMDRDCEWVPVHDRQTIDAGGATWTLSLPACVANEETELTPAGADHELERFVLEFDVSDNEESVRLSLIGQHERIHLPERAFHYVLLVLARARLADVAAGKDGRSAGWVARDDLLARLGASPEALNVDIHRARRQLADAGLTSASGIVERRHGAAELRLGTEAVVVHEAPRAKRTALARRTSPR